ncbi:Berberine and berberine like domain-containing protein [Phytophthora infestans]|uniref:Berberine and berberine like domain-containing protein n=1 Tax=Phytophthora infestans TaxID=4787 RepID=A0A8S9UDZ0_PHYIN|nr:Berberine and berberine like domain-containing protein [Phytophthora infestans]
MSSGGGPGGFRTYRDEKWTVPEMAEYLYGVGNFKKLQQIKTEVDPNEMFNTDPQAPLGLDDRVHRLNWCFYSKDLSSCDRSRRTL